MPSLPGGGRVIDADLDWVVMKCLEKDRNRRYETVNGLAADLRRFLADEPVTAMPPTAVYRFQKFFRRHRTFATAGALALAALLAGLGLSLAGFIKADRANTRAEAEAEKAKEQADTAQAVLAFVEDDLLAQADPFSASEDFQPDRDLKLRTALEQATARIGSRFEQQPLVEASIRLTLGRTFLRLGETEAAEPQIRRAGAVYDEQLGADDPRTLTARHVLGLLLRKHGNSDEAVVVQREALRRRQEVLGSNHPDTYESMIALAAALAEGVASFAEAEHLLKRVIRELERTAEVDEEVDLVADAKRTLSDLYWDLARWDEQDRLLEEVFVLRQRTLGIEHPSALRAAANRVYDLQIRFGDLRAAEALDSQIHQASVRVLGFEDGEVRILLFLKAQRLAAKGLWGAALALHHHTRDRSLEEFDPESPTTLWAEDVLGGALRGYGDFKEAEAIHRASAAVRLGTGQTKTVGEQRSMRFLAWAVFHQGRVEEAEQIYAEVVEQDLEAFGKLSVRSAYNSRHVVALRGKQAKWRGVTRIYQTYRKASFAHEPSADFPLGFLPNSAGIIAAELAGDESAVSELLDALLTGHGETTNAWAVTRIGLACLGLPEGRLSQTQNAEVLARAARAASGSETTPEGLLLSGLAAYRDGHFEQAALKLAQITRNPDHALASLSGYFNAMALFRLGEIEAADGALQEASRRLELGLRLGLLGHRGQNNYKIDLRWADYGRSLIVRDQAESLILGRVTSLPVTAATLAERRAEWKPTQELLNALEERGRRRDWKGAHSALVKAMEQASINWEPEGNFVRHLLPKALCLCVLAGDRERYEALLRRIMEPAETTQSDYCLPALLPLDDPTLSEEHLKMARYQTGLLQAGMRTQQRKQWALLKLGIAECRATQFDDASVTLARAAQAFNLNCSGAAHAYAAITAHRSGDNTAAAEHLEKAETLYRQLLDDNSDKLGQDWHEFALLEIALREARLAVRQQP